MIDIGNKNASFTKKGPGRVHKTGKKDEPGALGRSGDKLARMAAEKRVGIVRNTSYGQGLRNHSNNKPSTGRI